MPPRCWKDYVGLVCVAIMFCAVPFLMGQSSPTPDPTDGCAGYACTPPLPDTCQERHYVEFTSGEPSTQYACTERPWPTSPGFYDCAGWTPWRPMPCECYDNEDPPAGAVWRKEIP